MVSRQTSQLVKWLGALGYFSIVMQWFWLIALLLPWVLSLQLLYPSAPPPQSVVSSQPMPFVNSVVAIAAVVFVILVTVYSLSRLPKTILRETARVTHSAHDAVVPKVMPQKRVTKQTRQKISSRVLFFTKLVLCLLPFGGLYVARMTHPPLDDAVVMTVGVFLLFWSLLYVITQRVVAHLKKIDYAISL